MRKDEHKNNVFLFINSENYYNEGFEIKNVDYPFLYRSSSYICCHSIVSYKEEEMKHLTPNNYFGTLKNDHICDLVGHIENSEAMELKNIRLITAALRRVLAESHS